MMRTAKTALLALLMAAAGGMAGGGAAAAGETTPDERAGGAAAAGEGTALPADDMVLIPAGAFVMGDDDGDDASPAHRVRLNAFWMDRCEVTCAEYGAFCDATGHSLPVFWGVVEFRCGPDFPEHPVVGVSSGDAMAYAEWVGKRLPTEAEWEYAARGGLAGMPYDRGASVDSTTANTWRAGYGGTLPVGSFPPNGYGLHDMTGNVWEWVADWYDPDYYQHSPGDDPPGPDAGRFRVIRGGGWHSGPYCCRVHQRNALPAYWLDFAGGFRCVRDAGE
ncbi:MAG: formylglycine-generating enzyme family protein [Candidatus Krumholzibacteriota bacterium]|nr:formylglycine-generating enzyme family protein [Candidatus Krumholzibacteriota bacterium]